MQLRTSRERTKRTVVVFAFVALLTAACGSTLPEAQQQVAVEGDQPAELGGVALPPGAHVNEKGQVVTADGELIGTAEEVGMAVGSGDGTQVGGPGGGIAGSAGGRRPATSVGVNGPGVTDRSIT